jgi:hypothetical protein
MCTVASAPAAFRVRVWEVMSRGWDPWTERPLPEVVRVAYPQGEIRMRPRHLTAERFVANDPPFA